jgi:hypothetical protein
MDSAFVDTYLLAFPPADCELAELDSYVKNLLAWRNLIKSEAFPAYISSFAPTTLGELGGFPPWEAVLKNIQRLRPEEYYPGDVFAIIQYFLDRLPKIEDDLGIRDILLDEAVCDPSVAATRPAPWGQVLERLLGLICLFVRRNGQTGNHYVLTRGILPCPTTVNFGAKLVDVEWQPAWNSSDAEIPVDLQGSFTTFSCAQNWRIAIDPERLWLNTMSNETCKLAIELAVQRMQRQTGQLNTRKWRIGGSFVASVSGLNLGTEERGRSILRAIAETLLDQNMRATHHIRTDKGANSPQLTRGQDGAWRRDIDHEYHLHYWAGEQVELAAIVAHNDFHIPA